MKKMNKKEQINLINLAAWIILIAGIVLSFIIYREYGLSFEYMEYFDFKKESLNMIAVIDIMKINIFTLSAFTIIQSIKTKLGEDL